MTAPAVIAMKEKHIVAAFRRAHATTPDQARSLNDLRVHNGLVMRRLKTRAVLREASPDAYYLDEATWEALRRTRIRLVRIVLVVVLALAVVTVVLRSASH